MFSRHACIAVEHIRSPSYIYHNGSNAYRAWVWAPDSSTLPTNLYNRGTQDPIVALEVDHSDHYMFIATSNTIHVLPLVHGGGLKTIVYGYVDNIKGQDETKVQNTTSVSL